MMLTRRFLTSLVYLASALAAVPAFAVNATYQDFFFQACVNPSGALAARCSETSGGLGDLSGDSESSLNPSQALSQSEGTVSDARERQRELRDRRDRALRDIDEGRLTLGPFELVVNARGSDFEQDRRIDVDAERGFEGDSSSAEIGLDYRVNDRLLIGGRIHWSRADIDFDQEQPGVAFTPLASTAGEIRSDARGLTMFVAADLGDAGYLDGSVAFSDTESEIERNSVFQESSRTIAQTDVFTRASADGDTWTAALSWGRPWSLDALTLTPTVGLTWISTQTDRYVERDLTGSGLAMRVRADERDALTAHLGATASYAVSMEHWVWVPQLRVEYSRQLSADRSRARFALLEDLSSTTLNLRGEDPEDNRYDIALGAVAVLKNGWMPYLELRYARSGDYERSQIALGVRVEL